MLERRPEQLSGGQRQRVALGRAIVREPAVFLMDEPLSNLDAQLRVQTREELLRLHARLRTTTIYVTHDQIEAMTMGHRIVVMRGGVVQQVGPPQAVYDAPANTFVAAFLGSPRINLHAGTLEQANGMAVFRHGEITIPLTPRLSQLASTNGAAPETALGVRPEDVQRDLAGSERRPATPCCPQRSPSSSRSAPISSSAPRPVSWPGRRALSHGFRSHPDNRSRSVSIWNGRISSVATVVICAGYEITLRTRA